MPEYLYTKLPKQCLCVHVSKLQCIFLLLCIALISSIQNIFFSQMKGLPQKKVSNQPGPPKLPFNFKSVRDAKLKK